MRGIGFLIFLMVPLMLLTEGCGMRGSEGKAVAKEVPADTIPEADFTPNAAAMADSILKTMTLEEKAAQVLIPALYASDDFFTLRAVGQYAREGIGGIMLLKGDTASAKQISDSLRLLSRVRPFVAIDAEWGLGMRLKDAPRYPFNSELGAEATEEGMFGNGATVGAQCRELGIDMVLGPVVDVATRDSYMGKRSYGDNPERVSDLAIAYAKGLESQGVISVAKHFPGHGAAVGDSHRGKPVIYRNLHELDSIDLYPFRRYIAEGLTAVMVGHLGVAAVDPELRPAAVSAPVIRDLLRGDLGFEGLVLTDAMGMEGSERSGAVEALKAGTDVVLAPVNTRKELEAIVAAVRAGELDEAELDRHVYRILLCKMLREA